MRDLLVELRSTRSPREASVRRRRPRYGSAVPAPLVLLLCCLFVAPAAAEDVSRQQMQSLDEQVQDIKSDVLSISEELGRLEEKLLYPSETQVAVFVSLAEGETFRLDSVEIQIDGQPAAHHIYSFKELEALQKGGVQRIYTGNLPTGDHQLQVSVAGQMPGGRDFGGSQSFTFSKEIGPKLLGVTLAGREFGDASIELGGW